MSRTDKDTPFEVRRARRDPDVPTKFRSSPAGIQAYPRVRFHTNVSSRDIHEGYRVPERQAVRLSLIGLAKQAHEGAGSEIDDSHVELRPQRRNSVFGGGYFD